MAHLWCQTKEHNTEGAWGAAPLEVGAYGLSRQGLVASLDGDHNNHPSPSVLLVRRGAGRAEEWVLLARLNAHVRVNGQPLSLGIRCLFHRDEIVFGDAGVGQETARFFFSTERLARPETFRQSTGPIHCARCRQAIKDGDTVVCCPECGVFHHATSDLPCWDYSAACTCGYPTARNASFRWSPETI